MWLKQSVYLTIYIYRHEINPSSWKAMIIKEKIVVNNIRLNYKKICLVFRGFEGQTAVANTKMPTIINAK